MAGMCEISLDTITVDIDVEKFSAPQQQGTSMFDVDCLLRNIGPIRAIREYVSLVKLVCNVAEAGLRDS